jgi:hypothetical protein
MTKRGKVLRDPHTGPGLLMVEGQQYPFSLEGIWSSDTPPKPGLPIAVEFDTGGAIARITVIPESQLAREQAEAAMAAARQHGAALASNMVARFGIPNLVAAALLIMGWFFLASASIKTPFGGMDFSFWQILGFANSSSPLEGLLQAGSGSAPSAGIYGLLAIVALAGPFLHYFWKDKRANLGGLLPLLFMVIVALIIRSSLGNLGGNDAGNQYAGVAAQMREEAMKAVSLGMGAYLSLIVSLYFGAMGLKQFLAARAVETPSSAQSYKAAA